MTVNAFDWIWALLPMILGGAILVWVHNLQARIEQLELEVEELRESLSS